MVWQVDRIWGWRILSKSSSPGFLVYRAGRFQDGVIISIPIQSHEEKSKSLPRRVPQESCLNLFPNTVQKPNNVLGCLEEIASCP